MRLLIVNELAPDAILTMEFLMKALAEASLVLL
jgi:hypothetical protein